MAGLTARVRVGRVASAPVGRSAGGFGAVGRGGGRVAVEQGRLAGALDGVAVVGADVGDARTVPGQSGGVRAGRQHA